MKLVMKSGEILTVDTGTIFNNQYNTTDGERVFDKDVKYIIDDIRLGEFYCCSKKQGTYDEVTKAIAEERSKIHKCAECWWFRKHTRIADECQRERKEVLDGNKKTVITNERTVYEVSCAYQPNYGDKCSHDIDETPVLFREKQFCFFCEYPDGVPDMKPLRQFMVDNAEKYGIVPRWSDDELSVDTSFIHKKRFGSYNFEANYYSTYFILENARHCFKFYVDFANKKFILFDGLGFRVVKYFGTHEYSHNTRKSTYEPIKNYDKFATWFWQIVDDFMEVQNEQH